MLSELSIRDFAIIDNLKIEFHPGFNVMTGETGAGKSIIIDAVGALLGARIGAEFVRSGTQGAKIEGVFHLADNDNDPGLVLGENLERLDQILTEQGIELAEGQLILSRAIHKSGRSVCRINGSAVTLNFLQNVGDQLIDIHGQTEHLSLLRVSEHVDFLDRFADTTSLRRAVAGKVVSLRKVRKELSGVLQDERERVRRQDLLRYQVEEIAAAKLREGEEEELTAELRILANAEELSLLANTSYNALQGAGEGTPAALDAVREAITAIHGLAKLDSGMQEQSEQAEGLLFQLEDLASTLRDYRENVEYNPERLAEIEERLDLLRNLKRKYGSTIEEVVDFARLAAEDLEHLEHSEERAEELRQEEARLLQEIGRSAGELAVRRERAGKELSRAIERELGELNMGKARFEVKITRTEAEDGVPVKGCASGDFESDGEEARRYEFDASGIDRVEFHIAPNAGEPVKPLAKVASGGETSRLMLAMKTVLSRADATPTLIFDEIDVGIGGRSGQIVGEKLWDLSARHQVICVTHLPQIASFGDAHFQIAKRMGDRTRTELRLLSPEEQIGEISEMMGGETAKTRASAAEMLQRATQWKTERVKGANAPRPSGSGYETDYLPGFEGIERP